MDNFKILIETLELYKKTKDNKLKTKIEETINILYPDSKKQINIDELINDYENNKVIEVFEDNFDSNILNVAIKNNFIEDVSYSDFFGKVKDSMFDNGVETILNKNLSKDIKNFVKNEMWNWIKNYFEYKFKSDYKNGIYDKEIIKSENGFDFKSTKSKKDFIKKVLKRINEVSFLISKEKKDIYKLNDMEVFFHNNKVYKIENDKNILIGEGYVKQSRKSVLFEKQTLKIGSEIEKLKSFKEIVVPKQPFQLNNEGLIKGFNVSAAGKSDLVMFDEDNQRVIACDTTISKDSKLEGNSVYRHYIDNVIFLEKKIDKESLKDKLSKGKYIEEKNIKDIFIINANNFTTINSIPLNVKILYLLNKYEIPDEDYVFYDNLEYDGKKISTEEILDIKDFSKLTNNGRKISKINIDKKTIDKIIDENRIYLKYTYQFNDLESIQSNVLFLLSSSKYTHTIDNVLTSFDSIIQFYKEIGTEVVSDSGNKKINGSEIAKVLEIIKNILNNSNEEDIEKVIQSNNVDKENFQRIFYAFSKDLVDNKIEILNINKENLQKINKIFHDNNLIEMEISVGNVENTLTNIENDINNILSNEINNNSDFINNLIIRLENILTEEEFEEINEIYKQIKLSSKNETMLKMVKKALMFQLGIIIKNEKYKKEIIEEILEQKVSLKSINNSKSKIFKKISIEKEIEKIKLFLLKKEMLNVSEDLIFENIENILILLETDDEFIKIINDNKYITKDFIDKVKNSKKRLEKSNKIKIRKILSKQGENSINVENIIELLKLHNKEQKRFITKEYVMNIINKNYNGDLIYAYNDILNKYTYSYYKRQNKTRTNNNSIKDKSSKVIIENLDKKNVLIVDNDNDGSSAFAIGNLYKNTFNDNNLTIEYSKDTIDVRGCNYNHIKELIENKKLDKDGVVITADNGSNNIEEYKKIFKEFPNLKMIITDHHEVEEKSFEFYKNNPNIELINGAYHVNEDYSKIKELKYNISGATTLMDLFLNLQEQKIYPYEINEEQLNKFKKEMKNISDMANLMDMVAVEYTVLDESQSKDINNISNQLNSIPNIKKYVENFSVNEKINNYILNFNFLIEFIDKDNKIEELENLKSKYSNNDVNFFLKNINRLRPLVIEYYNKINKNYKEHRILDLMKMILKETKEVEKELITEFKNNNNFNHFVKDTIHFQVFDDKMSNKFYKKVNIPQNKEFTVAGFVKNNTYYGSLRSVKGYSKYITKEMVNKYQIKIQGHQNAAGFRMENYSEEKINKFLEELENSIKVVLKEEEEISSEVKNIYSINELKSHSIMMDKLETNSNIKNHKEYLYISKNDIKNIAITSSVEENYIENINKFTEDKDYYKMTIDFYGTSIIIKKSDVEELNKSDENTFIKLSYLGNKGFMSNGVEKINIETQNVNLPENFDIKRKEVITKNKHYEEYSKNHNKENNFTKKVSVEEFYNVLGKIGVSKEQSKELLEDYKKVLLSQNIERYVVMDIEGTGFGKYTGMTNYGAYNFELNKNNELEISFTSVVFKDYETSAAIQQLTHMDNNFINKNGITLKEGDEILYNLYKDKKTLFQAHNIAYDFNGINANTEKFGKLLQESRLIDSDSYVMSDRIVNDNNNNVVEIVLNENGKETRLGQFFNSEFGKGNNFSKFLKEGKSGTSYKNVKENIIIKIETVEGVKKVSVISDGFVTKRYNFKEFKSIVRKKYKKAVTKHSVQQLVSQIAVDKVRNKKIMEIIKEENEEGLYKNSIKLFKKELKEAGLEDIYDLFSIELSKKIMIEKIYNNYDLLQNGNDKPLTLKQIERKLNRKKQSKEEKEYYEDLLNRTTIAFSEVEELESNIEKLKELLEKNPNNYLLSDSVKLKKVIDKYINSKNKNITELEVSKETLVELDVVEEYSKIIKEFVNNGEFDNLKELHYNVNYKDADVSIESAIQILHKEIIKERYGKDFKEEGYFDKIYFHQIKTETKLLKASLKNLNLDTNTFTDKQKKDKKGIEYKKELTYRLSSGKKGLLISNKEIETTGEESQKIQELILLYDRNIRLINGFIKHKEKEAIELDNISVEVLKDLKERKEVLENEINKYGRFMFVENTEDKIGDIIKKLYLNKKISNKDIININILDNEEYKTKIINILNLVLERIDSKSDTNKKNIELINNFIKGIKEGKYKENSIEYESAFSKSTYSDELIKFLSETNKFKNKKGIEINNGKRKKNTNNL